MRLVCVRVHTCVCAHLCVGCARVHVLMCADCDCALMGCSSQLSSKPVRRCCPYCQQHTGPSTSPLNPRTPSHTPDTAAPRAHAPPHTPTPTRMSPHLRARLPPMQPIMLEGDPRDRTPKPLVSLGMAGGAGGRGAGGTEGDPGSPTSEASEFFMDRMSIARFSARGGWGSGCVRAPVPVCPCLSLGPPCGGWGSGRAHAPACLGFCLWACHAHSAQVLGGGGRALAPAAHRPCCSQAVLLAGLTNRPCC